MGNQQVSILGTKLIPIPEYDKYFTDINGSIFSFKKGNKERLLTPYKHFGRSKNPYMRVKIGNKLWLQHRFISSVLIGKKLNENE